MLRRLPIESRRPLQMFALARLGVALSAALVLVALGLPWAGRGAAAAAGIGVPWALLTLWVAWRHPDRALSPAIAAGDFIVLIAFEVAVPEAYAAVRFGALYVAATHAAFQGERRGAAVAGLGGGALVAATAIRGDAPVDGSVLAFYEVAFLLCCVVTAVVVGGLRSSESAGRLRARSLSRRSIQAESEVRRRVAEAIHDGPVQELIGLEMILSAARKAAADGRSADAGALLEEARTVAGRNVNVLRDEIVDLGPYAFQELSFETAIENCIPVWERRFGFEVTPTIERLDLEPEMAGDLFRIAQEAVLNAGRHAEATAVSINLRSVGSQVELRVTDDGRGFGEVDPLGAIEPGHLGLASMRERAELLDGELEIESSERGTRVLVRAPLPQPAR
jgi:two-component system, NarL family, sensor kinase